MRERFKGRKEIIQVLKIVKCLFLLYLVMNIVMKKGILYGAICIIELSIGYVAISKIKTKKFRNIVHSVYLFLIGIQMILLIYARTFLTLVMVDNIASIKGISGNALVYTINFGLLLMISLIPLNEAQKKEKWKSFLSIILAVELMMTMVVGNAYSPSYAYFKLLNQEIEQIRLQKIVGSFNEEGNEFYRTSIDNYINKPANLVEDPNIIIIFTEGLSQNVIDDKRKIMPNISAYQEKSLNVINYYNHTFATYRGLIGQLYSGYQFDNYDTNRLVSLQSIFRQEGYDTTFINTEPKNAPFTSYLEKMNFDHLESNISDATEGMVNSISDKDAYENLLSVMEEKEESEQPYLIAMYTFGTHVSLDSTDEIYGDGTDAELNKFYNADYQFGKFMEAFEKSKMAKDTVVIFTTDHCTYEDVRLKKDNQSS